MKKRMFSMIVVVAVMVNTCMVAMAADTPNATKNSLNSRGAIRYQEGQETVVIDSADLYALADRLDLFKIGVVKELRELHTFLSKDSRGVSLAGNDDIYVGHLEPSPENAVDPVTLDFSEILQGIAASQSIPQDPAAYGLPSDAKLYKEDDGKLTTDGTEEMPQIEIHPATAANLSAGAAAWVKGELVLGTGEDIAAMYNEKISNTNGSAKLSSHNISSGYTLPEDVASAYAYVVTTSEEGNNAGSDPTFTVKGGGSYAYLYSQKYARSGFNVRVALYHVINAPAGTVIKGSNGRLFY